ERRTELAEPWIGRRKAKAPAFLALLVRIAEIIVGAVDLLSPLEGEPPRAVLGAESAEGHVPDVEPRIALDDPGGHDPSHAAGPGDAVGAEATRDEEAADVRRLPENELTVGSECLGSVDEAYDLGSPDRRDAVDGTLHQRAEALLVGRQQLVVEVGGDAVEAPRGRGPLVAAGHQPADLLAK